MKKIADAICINETPDSILTFWKVEAEKTIYGPEIRRKISDLEDIIEDIKKSRRKLFNAVDTDNKKNVLKQLKGLEINNTKRNELTRYLFDLKKKTHGIYPERCLL